MQLKWYGHASFKLTDSKGFCVITDPYTPELAGYSNFAEEADLVIASSFNDEYHDRVDLIPGNPVKLNALDVVHAGGRKDVAGLEVQAMLTHEKWQHPDKDDPDVNAMYRFNLDGLEIGHMGDVGNPLDAEQEAFLEGLDILLTLAGDVPTIRLPDLLPVLHRIRPRLVVPMHFRTLTYRPRDGLWIESFLAHFNDEQVDFAFSPECTLNLSDLPSAGEMRVLVLDYAR